MEYTPGTTDNPLRLQEICLIYIAKNTDSVTLDVPVEGGDGLQSRKVFRGAENVYLHSNLSDALLATMSLHGTLTNETLSVFDPANTDLKHVKLHALPSISGKGLRVLR